MNLRELQNTYYDLSSQKKSILSDISEKNSRLINLKTDFEDLTKVRFIFTSVIGTTQNSFKEKVDALITSALQDVFEDRNFEFKLIFEDRGGKIGAKPVIFEDGEEFIPKEELGGSILDVISFVLQIIFLILETPQKIKFLILDEPAKFCGNLKLKFGMMMKELSKKLDIQILYVTHDHELASVADIVYQAKIKNNFSSINLVTNTNNLFKKGEMPIE